MMKDDSKTVSPLIDSVPDESKFEKIPSIGFPYYELECVLDGTCFCLRWILGFFFQTWLTDAIIACMYRIPTMIYIYLVWYIAHKNDCSLQAYCPLSVEETELLIYFVTYVVYSIVVSSWRAFSAYYYNTDVYNRARVAYHSGATDFEDPACDCYRYPIIVEIRARLVWLRDILVRVFTKLIELCDDLLKETCTCCATCVRNATGTTVVRRAENGVLAGSICCLCCALCCYCCFESASKRIEAALEPEAESPLVSDEDITVVIN